MKSVLTILLIFLGLICKSQDYIPFPDSNAVWKVVWYTYPGQYYEEHFEYFPDGDTLIYDTLYTKLRKVEYNVVCSLDTLSSTYAGAFRNDTANRKVYYIPVFPPVKKILYDFSLNVGDTVPDSFQNYLFPWLTVKDIDTIYINGEQRKRFTYWEVPDPLGYQFFVYEGIGSDIGLLEPYANVEIFYYLKCFHNENFLEYIHPGDTTCTLESDTCLTNSLDDLSIYGNSLLDIYLSNDQIVIRHDYNLKNISVYVYDLQGILIYQQKVDSDISYIEKNVFHNGLYIFLLNSDNIPLSSRKIIINQ